MVVPLPPIREVGVALVGAGQEGRGGRATVTAGDMKCSKDHIVAILGDMQEEEEAAEEATSREAGEEEGEVSTTVFSVKTPFVPGLRPLGFCHSQYETEVAWYICHVKTGQQATMSVARLGVLCTFEIAPNC